MILAFYRLCLFLFQEFFQFRQLAFHHLVGVFRFRKFTVADLPDILSFIRWRSIRVSFFRVTPPPPYPFVSFL